VVDVSQPQLIEDATPGSSAETASPRWKPPSWLVELVLLDLSVAGNAIWLLRAVAGLLLLLLPGKVLLRAMRIPAASIRAYIAYLPCGSAALLIGVTLAVDLLGPPLGVQEPLRPLPVLVGVNIAVVVLAFLGRRAPEVHVLTRSDVMAKVRWLWPLVLPVASVAAASRLDNGGGKVIAVLVLVATVVMIPVCTVLAERLQVQQINAIIYGFALSLLLLTSMRSAYVVGFDINAEYYDFHQAVVQGIWHTGHLDPYEAMLSLTVLPASLHALIGGQDVWIFKLVYPALFALFPVAVFSIGTRFLSRRTSFVAAAIVLVQSYFFEQQPEIARQEFALLLFAGIIGALLDSSIGRWAQRGFIAILGVSLVLSHYSTTYIAVLICLIALIVASIASLLGRKSLPLLPLLTAVVFMSAGAVIWYVPVTHSGNDIAYVAETLREEGLGLLPGRAHGENIISSYFNGVRKAASSASSYETSVAQQYKTQLPFVIPLPGAKNPAYNLQNAPAAPVTNSTPLASTVFGDAELVVQQVFDALGALAALVFLLRRRGEPISRMMAFLGAAALVVLTASRLSGTLAEDYNPSRVFLQCLFVFSLLEAAFLDLLAARFSAPSWTAPHWSGRTLRAWITPFIFSGFGLLLAIAFVGNSGLATSITGASSLALANSGEDYNRFFPDSQERAAAQWLASAVPTQRVIYADVYAQLRLNQFTGLRRAVFNDVTPRTIDQHAWVYASRANIVDNLSWGVTDFGELDITFPKAFLDEYFNVVYSTGTTEIFHR
jgi:uncharacterized membrane protein